MRIFQLVLVALLLTPSALLNAAEDPDYSDNDLWLCHPQLADSNNVCQRDQSFISVAANGSSSVMPGYIESSPAIDCFYVYPTASTDITASSNLRPDAQEKDTTAIQFGRYGEICRQYAPVYRQRTLTYLGIGALGDGLVSEDTLAAANETAYADVRNAFLHYLTHENQGRGVLLVGHSQGARLLARLIQEEFEGQPERQSRLVAAHLIGTGIEVPVGGTVGGTFSETPLCSHGGQSGCVVAYSSFRQDDPELATPRFGAAPSEGFEMACTHPAALAGGEEALDVRLPFDQPYAFDVLLAKKGSGGPYRSWWKNLSARNKADFYSVPGQFSGQCIRNSDGTHYLEVSIEIDADDPRADEYRGELIVVKGWGLHLIDLNLAQGDLIRLASDQINHWLSQ